MTFERAAIYFGTAVTLAAYVQVALISLGSVQ